MPIVRTLECLKVFLAQLMDKYNKNEIALHTLEYEISLNFGFSKYHQENIKGAMLKYGLLKPTDTGSFEIQILKSKEDLKKEAEAELKNLGFE